MRKAIQLASISILMLLVSCGASDSIDKLIIDTATIGAINNIELKTETKSKGVNGGKFIRCYGVVPAGIRRDQVKPTLLSILRKLKKNYPSCEWIIVYLPPTENKHYGSYAGIGEYREGTITLKYGVPSDDQIRDWNYSIGKKTINPITNEEYMIDYRPLFRPDDAMVRLGYRVGEAVHNIEKAAMPDIDIKYDDNLFMKVSRQLGCTLDQTRDAFTIVTKYFQPGIWGHEEITS